MEVRSKILTLLETTGENSISLQSGLKIRFLQFKNLRWRDSDIYPGGL